MLQVSRGDEAAFRVLYDQYRDKVYAIACKLLHTQAEAKDALQDIFLKIWQGRESLAGISYFSSYLNTITRNHLLNLLRKRLNEQVMKSEVSRRIPVASDGYEIITVRELRHTIRGAMQQLPPQQQKVFELSRIDGVSLDEIADQLQISRETAKKHLTRANQQLRVLLRANTSALILLGIMSEMV
ncbi:RNA polymerase sigma-70 factor [Chitinophaga horti]|uniref:RNA polymerase sigma-70 factor n=1 Tax=Chitinophaga horti TaxID=2920382 RepID=A0ABY6IW95_9BACT|nr:RNA polymerase sigma-70 factor [Chitinophaga horti]UYQ91471.1 RNA polymerase sigma-70 factor [Chitinophaga horti]